MGLDIKKLLPLVVKVVIALAVLGGGAFGYKMYADKKKAAAAAEAAKGKDGEAGDDKKGAPDEEEDEAPAESGGHGGAAKPAPLVYKNIVNLEGPRKNTYLKLELHVIFRDAELGREAAGDKPTAENSEIRATILELISGKKLEEVQDLEAREALRLEIKDRLNDKFKPKPPKEGEKVDPKHKKPKHPIKDVLVVDWAIAQG